MNLSLVDLAVRDSWGFLGIEQSIFNLLVDFCQLLRKGDKGTRWSVDGVSIDWHIINTRTSIMGDKAMFTTSFNPPVLGLT